MHRNSQNGHYRCYSHLPLSSSTYSRNNHHQYNDSRLHIQRSLYSNTTPIVTYTPPRFHQQYQPSTNISDLAEPLSVFDDLKFPKHHRSNVIPFPLVRIPSNPTQRTSVNDPRLATSSVARKRLLHDIQHNISEIDQELSLLERRPSILPRISSIDRNARSSDNDNQMKSTKPKRIYEVIPRITSESKIISRKQTDQTNSYSYIGHYHYGAEIEEIEIVENDPENSDLKSTIDEIPELNIYETCSLDQFRREQSALPQNRALIFVPEYIINNEIAEDSHQDDPTDTNTTRSTSGSSKGFLSVNRLNIQSTPEPEFEILSPDTLNPNEFSYAFEADLANGMLS